MQLMPLPDADQVPTAEDLLFAIAGGDAEAFARLYLDVGPRVHALAARIIRDADHAQEVAQEVLTAIWRTASCFDPGRGSALGWVLMMTHHRAVDRVRSEAASRRRDRAYGLGNVGVPFDETFAAGAARVESTAVRAAFAALTPLQREAIELCFLRGLTQSQVARHLDVPLGTIKSRIRDGLGRMRTALPDLAPEAA